MEGLYFEDQEFGKTDYKEKGLLPGDYDHCIFTQCDLSGTDLSRIIFTDCTFTGCNLSLARLAGASLKNVHFISCKLVGLQFRDCHPFLFKVDFDNCVLDLSSFVKQNMKKTVFRNSSLHEVDFSETDLTGSLFEHCDLAKAIFDHSNLEQCDFRTACNYSIDPGANRVKKAQFSLSGISGLLDKFDIHIEA